MNISATGSTIVFGMIAFTVFVFLHVLIWQAIGAERKGVQLLVITAFIAYVSISIVFSLLSDSIKVFHYASLPLFCALIMFYMHLYVGIERSVSIRILGELIQAPEGRLSIEELRMRYPGDKMIKHRVELMRKGKWLIGNKDRYYCAKKAVLLSRLTVVLQRLYRISVTG